MNAERSALAHDDFHFVDGREKLPNVGKVTEKSASWWLTIAKEKPGYDFYCKSDDDTLVHLDRLRNTLAEVERKRPGQPIYFGHIKWRGWDVGHRFQACGGGWGPARKTGDDIAVGGVLPGGRTYPPCPHAAGPYPYMSGGMVCMSAAMQKIVARDEAFCAFLTVARSRNDHGVPCKKKVPAECAMQPSATKMWHHEDAGIGFNVFRAAVAANASIAVAAVPGHNNDVGPFVKPVKCPSPWSRCAAEAAYWSDRAVFTHQVKSAKAYADVAKRWNTTRPLPNVSLACAPCSDAKRGPKYGAWTEARLPCTEDDDAFCAVDVGTHFRCCHFEGGFVPPTPPALPRVWRPRRRRKAHTLQPGGVGVELLDGITRGRVL